MYLTTDRNFGTLPALKRALVSVLHAEKEHKTIAIAHQAQSLPQTAGPDATRKHMLT
jgi:hypothetical protein